MSLYEVYVNASLFSGEDLCCIWLHPGIRNYDKKKGSWGEGGEVFTIKMLGRKSRSMPLSQKITASAIHNTEIFQTIQILMRTEIQAGRKIGRQTDR